MSVEISQYTLSRLDDDVPEIKQRALATVEAKFKIAGANLVNLDVNPYDLAKHLIGWLQQKPVSDVNRVLQLLIAILNSKYKLQLIPLLSSASYKENLKQIGRNLIDCEQRLLFREFLRIISDYLEREACFINVSQSDNMSIEQISSRNELLDGNETENEMDPCKSFRYTNEWDMPGASDSNSLKLMKTSLAINTNEENIEHALKFFGNIVHDFPAEYFLQPPYIFVSFTKLINAKDTLNKFDLLNAILQLTKSLTRRITNRRLSKTYIFKQVGKKDVPRKQVTVGTFCMQIFQSILAHLQDIYNTAKLNEINVCLLILTDIVDLFCLEISPTPSKLNTTDQHNIHTLLQELGLFLKYIRECAAHTNHLNEYKTTRNNSIMLIYTICRLVMYKDSVVDNKTGTDKNIEQISKRLKQAIIDDSSSIDSNVFNTAAEVIPDSREDLRTWRSRHNSNENVWRKELELAVLDYPLKHFYSDVHDLLLTTLKMDSFSPNSSVKVLFGAEDALRSAVALLKDTNTFKEEQLFVEGIKAFDVFAIVQSGDLVVKLFTEISNLAPKFDGNESLRKLGEKLLLSIISHENNDLKRTAYRLAADKMTHFFSCLMDGTTFIAKSYASNTSKSNFLGLPLTTDILIEIICFGLNSNDQTIASNAEKIVSLILRSKNIIPHYWDHVCEILIPVLGLLQCFVRRKYAIGDVILQLSDPDDEIRLPKLHLIEANIRLLFNREMRIREEAIFRLSYILQSDPNSHRYIPNIDSLSDLLPNNICIPDHIFDPERNQFSELYEQSYVTPMIKLLNSPDVEPSIRRTTLIQLNVMLQDPSIVDYFFNCNGLTIVVDILKQSLLVTASQNYADNVVPAVGILAKLCIQKSAVRRAISSDNDAYATLIRALFINHHNDVFKTDCAIVLFLTSYAEFALGSNQLSLPALCQRLLLPFRCEYHWRTSSFNIKSPLEQLLLSNEDDQSTDRSDSMRALSRMQTEKRDLELSAYWQFIRMTFTNLWFGSLEEALAIKLSDANEKSLNYVSSNNNKSLGFNQKLCLTSDDIKAIQNSWPLQGIDYWTKCLQNATSHEQVTLACAAIENFSNIDSTNNCGWDFHLITGAIERYADITPKGENDERMFRSVIHLLRTLLERGSQNIVEWCWKNFNKKNSVFLDILCKEKNACKEKNWSAQLYLDNAQLIEIALDRFVQCGSELIKLSNSKNDVKLNQEEFRQFFERLFEMVNNSVDEAFEKRDSDKLYAQLSLLRAITGSMQIHCDDYTASFLAKKLLRFITAMKCLAQAGSNFNKNCLLTIGNVMLDVDELKLDPKQLGLLSGICGHTDYEIRAYSWCILAKVANTLNGAEALIRELSYLPGGFHACCLSTMLDVHEPSIVRENAAYTFAALISYCDERNNLCEKVYPRCMGTENDLSPTCDEFTIFRILKQHNFYRELVIALKNFCPTETIDFNEVIDNLPLTSCDLVRSFSVVLASIAGLNSRLDADFLIDVAIEIMRLVPFISNSVNNSSVLLLTEICTFLLHYLLNNREMLERVAAQEVYLIRSLVSLLDINLYDDIPKTCKAICWSQILTLLRLLARTPYGFRAICNTFDEKPFASTFYFILNALKYQQTLVPVLKFCTTLLVVGQLGEHDFPTFANHLNGLFIDENITKYINNYESDDSDDMDDFELLHLLQSEKKYAAEVLYEYWCDIFERCKFNCQVADSIFKAIEALLKCSHLARASASKNGLLYTLVEDLERIHADLGMSCSEYIRRNGNLKLEKVLHKIKLHFNIILSWYSMDTLKDTAVLPSLMKVFIRLWPWMNSNFEILHRFMKLLTILCDDSLPVCKGMTTIVIGNSQSLLQLVAAYCSSESTKVKNPQANLEVLALALRVVSNCCSCFEGRNQINKTNMLQTLSRLHPYIIKQQKQWNRVLLLWLQFYEIFTRYPDIASGAKHINLLRTLVEHGQHELGICALEIIRNMAFNVSNRTALLTSDDFLYTMKLALDTPSMAVQLLAVTSIWKLISQNYKGRHIFKNSIIYQKINKLYEKLKRAACIQQPITNEEDEENQQDLITALECVIKILSE